MAEKKIHWKTAERLKKQNSEALSEEVHAETVEKEVEIVPEVIPEPIKKEKGKTQWTVVYQERGLPKEFTYFLSDTEDAYERALKLAIKKGGKVI